ncbi:MAG: DNA repair protein RadA [Chloroflexi bacterium GWC2_73_18]|nr:MAG: DNA repair protein RadA [Chloroflexi bacterium GWC2_73_18]
MARPRSRYTCQACGWSAPRWEGQCRDCGAWNTLVETPIRALGVPRRIPRPAPGSDAPVPVPLADLAVQATTRFGTGLDELDRVLGGGAVVGSVMLLAGEPGVGKSTLVLAAAAGAAAVTQAPVLYASGEESAAQLHLRASRLGLADGPSGAAIRVLATTETSAVVEAARRLQPALIVVDSIQTMTCEELEGGAGSIGQVRESALRLAELAKTEGMAIVLVGHVTKDGTVAGPKTLEHLVDVVLALEGERAAPVRLLRATKNRFGSTEEVGVFEMGAEGLRPLADPSRAFLSAAPDGAPGSVVAMILEGSRPMLVEVQALVGQGSYGAPRRAAAGLDLDRLVLVIAVLGRRAGVGVGSHDVYVNLAGGLRSSEPALDLPLAVALASSLRDRSVSPGTVVTGEVGLLGELRPIAGLERRLREAARLGYRRAIVPAGGRAAAEGLEVAPVRTLREALDVALEPAPGGHGAAPPEVGPPARGRS